MDVSRVQYAFITPANARKIRDKWQSSMQRIAVHLTSSSEGGLLIHIFLPKGLSARHGTYTCMWIFHIIIVDTRL